MTLVQLSSCRLTANTHRFWPNQVAEIWFIRHFRTPWNAEGRFQGRRDIGLDDPLKPQDIAMLAANREALKQVAFADIWCSPLMRTQQTAALHGFHTPTIISDLVELDFGPFEGVLKSEMEAIHPGKWQTAPQDLPLGESFATFIQRVARVLSQAADLPGGPILVFGHGAWSGCMRCLHQGQDPAGMASFGLANGALLRLTPQKSRTA